MKGGTTYVADAAGNDVLSVSRKGKARHGTGAPVLGPAGAVYRIHPRTGATRLVAEGLVSATGLAVNKKGDIYVSQLFAGQIARITKGSGTPRPWPPPRAGQAQREGDPHPLTSRAQVPRATVTVVTPDRRPTDQCEGP